MAKYLILDDYTMISIESINGISVSFVEGMTFAGKKVSDDSTAVSFFVNNSLLTVNSQFNFSAHEVGSLLEIALNAPDRDITWENLKLLVHNAMETNDSNQPSAVNEKSASIPTVAEEVDSALLEGDIEEGIHISGDGDLKVLHIPNYNVLSKDSDGCLTINQVIALKNLMETLNVKVVVWDK